MTTRSDPFDDVQPLTARRTSSRTAKHQATALLARTQALGVIPDAPLPPPDPSVPDDPATIPELARMLSRLARQLFTEATNTDRKSYEREHLGRTLAGVADKLADLLDRPIRPETPAESETPRSEYFDLALRLASMDGSERSATISRARVGLDPAVVAGSS